MKELDAELDKALAALETRATQAAEPELSPDYNPARPIDGVNHPTDVAERAKSINRG